MKITRLTLYSDVLDQQKVFYVDRFGFELINEDSDAFTIRSGWTEITFIRSSTPHLYHYCFLIPTNKFSEAFDWTRKRVKIIQTSEVSFTQHFDTWNADSFYFYDPSGNLAEMIVRYDLPYLSSSDFDSRQVLCLNEIGLPTANIKTTSAYLQTQTNVESWKGDFDRFGTVGSQDGLFLLPNYNVKKTWFPTELIIQPTALEAEIRLLDSNYHLVYDGDFEVTKLS